MEVFLFVKKGSLSNGVDEEQNMKFLNCIIKGRMKRKVMNLQEGKLLKTWLKRKVRVTEALIVAFFIAGNLGYGQDSSSQNENTKEGGIAIGRLIEVELKNGAVISVFPKANENGKYSFAEKGNAKAELFKDYEAGFHLKNMKNGYSLIGRYNENYEKVIGKNNHSNNSGEDKYANSKTNNGSSDAQDSDEDKIAKSIAIGGNSVARNASIAIGDYAFASKKMDDNNETKDTVKGSAIAIGSFATATASSAISLGAAASAQGSNSIALGRQSVAVEETSIAVGKVAAAAGKGSIAIGSATEAEGENSVVIGKDAKVEVSNSVALGADSEVKKYEKVEEVKIKPLSGNSTNGQANSQDEIKIPTEKFAGMKKNDNGSSEQTLGVVSIGKKDHERQLQHVAAGRISQDSTDAINGSQLFAVASYLSSGWKIANGNGYVGDVSLGKQVSFVGEKGVKVSVENDNGKGYKVKISTPEAVTKKDLKDLEKKGLNFMGNDGMTIHRKLGQTLRIKGEGITQKQSKDFKSAKGNINIKQNGKSILEVQLAKNLKHIESISNGGETKGTKITLETGRKEVNVNHAKITNVADGKADTDAVNLKQLKEYNIKLEKKGLSFVGNDEETVHRNLGSTLNIKGEGLSKQESTNFKGAKGNINVKKSDKDGELLLQLAEKLQNIQSISNKGSNGGTTIILKEKEIVVNKDLHMGEKGSEHQIKHLKEGTETTDAVNKGQLDREVARASTEIKAGKNIEIKETIGTNGQKQYEVGLKNSITLGEKADSKVTVDGTNGKVTIGDKISLNGKTGEAKFGKIQMNQEKNEKGDTKATITGLENTDIIADDFAKKGRAATEEQLQKVHQDANKKIENLSREITNKGLNFGADKGKNVHRNLGDTQKIVGDKKNIMTSVEENGDIQVALNSEISVEKVSIPKKEGGEAVAISSENGVGNIYLAGKPGEDGKTTGAKISVEEGKAGVEAKDPKEKMERIVYQDSTGNSHTVATHDDGLKFEGDDGKTVNKKLNETLYLTGGEKDPKKLSQGNIGVISTENGGLTIQLAKELKDLSKITLIDGNGNKAVIDGGSLVFEGKHGKKTSLTSNGLNNGGNRITNVAAGEAATDAVNVSQLNEVKGAVQQNAQRIDKMNGEMRRGLASAAAMSGLEFMEIGINQGTVAAAVGGWKGTQAVAVGIQGAPTENVRINGKVSVAPGYKQVDTMYSVGASYRFNWK
ncbi:YadA-like C-terminal domain protein [Fusobacterium necrophorum subsp. funduliforme]